MTQVPNTEFNTDMKKYYNDRAEIYDRVYSYPERQSDLRFLETYVRDYFSGLQVLEVAAGTGYWSQFIAMNAQSLLATDGSVQTLKVLQQRPAKTTSCIPILVQQRDAYSQDKITGQFDAGFAGCWLSHVPRQQLAEFLTAFHGQLEPGSKVLFLDNSLAQCERLPITATDDQGNTYQNRLLDDGSHHKVLKNFPTEEDMSALLGNQVRHLQFEQLTHYWTLEYQLI